MVNRLVDYSIVPLLALVAAAWGYQLDWRFDGLSLLNVFPLLGLIAFATMWWHFFTAFIGRLRPDFSANARLHKLSGIWVFVAFMLHPALLAIWGMQNEYSSALATYEAFVGRANMPFIYLGMFGLTGFILFDIGRVLSQKPLIIRNQRIITAVSDLAWLAIFIHSLAIGRVVRVAWFYPLWLALGISGLGFIGYRYYREYRHASAATA